MKWRNLFSRRKALRMLGLGGFSAAGASVVNASSKKADAFALVGDRWHNQDLIKTALNRTLAGGTGLTIDYSSEVADLNAETLSEYRLLIIFRDGMIVPGGYFEPVSIYDPDATEILSDPPHLEIDETPEMWMTTEQGSAVKAFVSNGGSAFFFHNASHISLSNEDFRDVEGAIYTGHPPLIPFEVTIENTDHPITRGVKDFVVTDDQHYVIYDKDPKHVLMRSRNFSVDYVGSHGNQGRSCECGWAYDYDRGRVVFMSPGHLIPTLWNPEYVKLQKNAVRWLLREI
ncbi:ThuA domain-containing protein [Candidatus Latescibacterota bacterium]